ncbi:Flp pilus assembly protein CpaB [Desulfogranum japonicum]|uniref:Flp pilus assembly protein CpaB n=1 Tax=Desulfogranum japonicum TaxID=231447 RepID=UPI0004299A9D|nr:Flp pilus assembly protein CpaB [Desulfogranum japonicum]
MSRSMFAGKNSIIIPLILAGIGVFLVFQYLKTKEGELGLSADLVPVVVANVDIPAYTKLDKTMIRTFAVPRKFIPPSALQSIEEANKRVSLVPILKGDHILETMVSGQNQAVGLSLKIRQGYRAVSVGVDAIRGVSGLLRPGDKVDVLGTFKIENGDSSKQRTFTVLRNILVLAVGRNMGQETMVEQAALSEDREDMRKRIGKLRTEETIDYEKLSTVTLLVEPSQAQKVFLTQEIGTLSLSLCPVVNDNDGEPVQSIDGKDMLGIKEEIYAPRPWGEIHGAQRQ